MKKMLSVKLDSTLYNRLESIATRKGVSKSFLVRKQLESLLSETSQEIDLRLLKSMTVALRKNKSFPFRVNWKRIEKELAESMPPWPSADEAMKRSRKRR